MRLFLSYARRDALRANALVQRMERLGHYVWLDGSMTGGQAWWDEIIHQIQVCDCVVSVLSPAYLRSEPCRSEREYANVLGKALLPIAVEPVPAELVPADIARYQIIDYSNPGEESAISLALSLSKLSLSELRPSERRSSFPPPPPAPVSYLAGLGRRVAASSLSYEEQMSVLSDVEHLVEGADDEFDPSTVAALLHSLGKRRDLYAEADRRLQRLRKILDARPGPVPAGDGGVSAWADEPAPTTEWKVEDISGVAAAKTSIWKIRITSTQSHTLEFRGGMSGKLILDDVVIWKGSDQLMSAAQKFTDGGVEHWLTVATEKRGMKVGDRLRRANLLASPFNKNWAETISIDGVEICSFHCQSWF